MPVRGAADAYTVTATRPPTVDENCIVTESRWMVGRVIGVGATAQLERAGERLRLAGLRLYGNNSPRAGREG